MELDSSQWRSWPQGGSAPAEPQTPEPSYDPPGISTDELAGNAASCLRDWGLVELDKSAALSAELAATPVTIENIWRHHDAHPFVLLLLALDRYGEGVVEWLPDTVRMTFEKDGTVFSNGAFTKLLAARTLLGSPSPWRQWEVFHWVCRGLSGSAPSFVYLEEPEIGHLFVGADLLRLTEPKRKTGLEVDKYVAATFRTDGIHYAPPPLDFAQREIEQPQIQCQKCEAIHRDDNDTKCVSCGAAALKPLPYAFAASRDETKRLWEERKALPLERAVDGLPDSGAGNAVYRLLVQWDYARQIRSQMLQQLRMIGGTR